MPTRKQRKNELTPQERARRIAGRVHRKPYLEVLTDEELDILEILAKKLHIDATKRTETADDQSESASES